MKTFERLVLKSLVFLAMANISLVSAQAQRAAQAHAGEKKESGPHHLVDVPQALVVCTGWHALCTVFDCKMNDDKTKASCDCFRVNETNIVETFAIQDTSIKHLTEAKCTTQHPCAVDQAPVCEAIKDGQYKVDNVKYEWVSTYSYRGWCDLLKLNPKPCDQRMPGYTGDLYWAVCDAVPCTENSSNPDRPLTCQCPVQDSAFVGANGSCTGDNGGIMSSMPIEIWDFRNNTYRIPMPGYEYVQGACAPSKSDPLVEPRSDSDAR